MIAQKYRLEQLLGVGGVGVVYRAENVLLGRTVAIKLLKPEFAQNKELISRFVREARAANLVRHTNVVDVLDVGLDDAGVPYIVQELLQGEDLGKYLERRGSRRPVEEVSSLMLPVIDAVAFAHVMGVVHRDLKPENVFLARVDGGVLPKVLDFGISKMGIQRDDVRITSVGISMGTPAYMSPEQIQRFSEIDARADVWALGVMLYEMTAGRLPFDATSTGAMFVDVCTKDPIPLQLAAPSTPLPFAQVVMRCLRRDPDERYPTAAELARDVRNLTEGRAIEPTKRIALVSLAPPSIDAEQLTAQLSLASTAPEAATMAAIDSSAIISAVHLAQQTAAPPPADPTATISGVVHSTGPMSLSAVAPAPPTRMRAAFAAVGTVALLSGFALMLALGRGHTARSTAPRVATVAALAPAPLAATHSFTLLIESTPQGATVTEDGSTLGTTPLSVPMDGAHDRQFAVALTGYVPYVLHQMPTRADAHVMAPLVPRTTTVLTVGTAPAPAPSVAHRAARTHAAPTALAPSRPRPSSNPALDIRTER